MADTRICNRCGAVTPGVCTKCRCPEFSLLRDPQRLLWVLFLLAVVSGCEAAKAPTEPLTEEERIGLGVAWAMASSRDPAAPEPAPAPEPPRPPRPGDVCPECEGRGKVSRDGNTWTQCLPCKGTGRVQGAIFGGGGVPKTRTVYRKVCRPDGTCTLIPETEQIQ